MQKFLIKNQEIIICAINFRIRNLNVELWKSVPHTSFVFHSKKMTSFILVCLSSFDDELHNKSNILIKYKQVDLIKCDLFRCRYFFHSFIFVVAYDLRSCEVLPRSCKQFTLDFINDIISKSCLRTIVWYSTCFVFLSHGLKCNDPDYIY